MVVAEVLNCCDCGAREVVEEVWEFGEVGGDMLILMCVGGQERRSRC